MVHKPDQNLHKGNLVLDINAEPYIVIDDIVLSPIRLVRFGSCIISVWADELEVVDKETWRKAVIVKMKTP